MVNVAVAGGSSRFGTSCPKIPAGRYPLPAVFISKRSLVAKSYYCDIILLALKNLRRKDSPLNNPDTVSVYLIARDVPNYKKRDVPIEAAIAMAARHRGFPDLNIKIGELDILNDATGYGVTDRMTLGNGLKKIIGYVPNSACAGSDAWSAMRLKTFMPPPRPVAFCPPSLPKKGPPRSAGRALQLNLL